MTTYLVPTAEWRQNDDGTWEVVRQQRGGTGNHPKGGTGSGGSFDSGDILAGDNIQIVALPGGAIRIQQGGHAIEYESVDMPWKPILDFQGPGVRVTDAEHSTVVFIEGADASTGAMIWRGEFDPDIHYVPGDVVSDGAALFVMGGVPGAFGFGFGGFGDGPFGSASELSAGFGGSGFGGGGFGGL